MKISKEESLSKNQSASYSDLPSSLKEKIDLDEDVEFFNTNMFENHNLDVNNNPKKYYFLNDEIKKHKSDKKMEILPKFKITLENIKEENSDLETSREIFKEKKGNSKKLSFTEKSYNFKNSKIFNKNHKNIFRKILNTISDNNNKNKQLFSNKIKDKISKKLTFNNEIIKDKENIKVHNIGENLLKTNSPLKIENFKFNYLSPPIKQTNKFKSKRKILKLINEDKYFSTKTEKSRFINNLVSNKKNLKKKYFLGSHLKLKLEKNKYFITKSESIKNLKEKRKKLFKKMKNCSLNTFKNSSSSINKKQSSLKNINKKMKLYNKNFLQNIYLKEFDFSFNKYVNLSKKEKSKKSKKKSKKENMNLFKRYKNLGIISKDNNKINYNNIQNIYSKNVVSKKPNSLFLNKSPLNRKIFSYKEKYLNRSKRMFKNLYIKCLKNNSNEKYSYQKKFGNLKAKKKKQKSKNLKKKKMLKVKKNNYSLKKNLKRDFSYKEIFNKKKGHLINLY